MYLDLLYFRAKHKLHEFFRKENGDVNVLSMVLLVAIAVVAAILFKDKIGGMITKLFEQAETQAKNIGETFGG